MNLEKGRFSWTTHWLAVCGGVAPFLHGFVTPQVAMRDMVASYGDAILINVGSARSSESREPYRLLTRRFRANLRN